MKLECPPASELEQYLRQELDETAERRIDAHLSQCPYCVERLSQLNPTPPELAAGLQHRARLAGADTQDAWPLVPGYELLGVLGQGGMGVVYRAREMNLRRELAVKVLARGLSDHAAARRRFLEEAHIAGQMQHPGIVVVHELGELDDGRPFLAMKLVRGRTLAELLAERFEPKQGLAGYVQIFGQVCQALAHAHTQRVIHRDLKPHNIMVGAFGEVQIVDWGLAKVLQEVPSPGDSPPVQPAIRTPRDEEEPWRTEAALGTWAYMSPEQARGEVKAVDERSDVFSLGSILCEILTGTPAYQDEGMDPVATQARQALLQPALERLSSAEVDPALKNLAQECLSQAPNERPRDASVIAAALAAYQTNLQARVQRAEAERVEAEVTAREERKRRRRTLSFSAAIVVTLLLGIGGTVFGLVGVKKSEKEQRRLLLDSYAEFGRHSLQVGNWQRALEGIDQAIAEGHPEQGPLRLQRAQVLLALGRAEAAIVQLDELVSQPRFAAQRTVALLWQGVCNYARNPTKAKDLVEAAQREGLTETVDQLFAKGLLASASADAVRDYEAVLATHPAHVRARHELVVELFFLGRKEESHRQLQVARSLFPEDRKLLILEALTSAGRGDLAEARQWLKQCKTHLSPEEVAATAGMVNTTYLLQHLEKIHLADPITFPAILRELLGPDGGEFGQLADLFHPQSLSGILAALRVTPRLQGTWGEMLHHLEAWKRTGDNSNADRILAATARVEEGTILFLRGQVLVVQRRFREAEAAFLRASQQPSVGVVKRLALCYAVRCQCQLTLVDAANQHQHLARMLATLRRCLNPSGLLPPLLADRRDMIAQAYHGNDFPLGMFLLAEQGPFGDFTPAAVTRNRALFAEQIGNHQMVITEARKLIGNARHGKFAEELIRNAQEKLRAELPNLLSASAPTAPMPKSAD